VSNGSTDKIEKGLLRGVTEEEGGFIWIKTLSKVARMCSLNYYNILSVETHDGQTRCLTFFKAETHEQVKALELINKTVKEFEHIIEEKSGLINVEKYTNTPTENEMKAGTSTTANKPISCGTKTPTLYTGNHHSNLNNPTPYRREPEAMPFKREDRKPTKAALKKMRDKVLAISKGEFDYKLPKIKKEEKTKAAGK